MKTADLEAEHFAAVRNLNTTDAQELCDRLEISFFLVIIHRMVGVMPIRLDRSGRMWEPDPESKQLAYITPLRIDRTDSALTLAPWDTPRCGDLVDLIAWDPRQPTHWALRTGSSLWVGAVPFGEPFPAVIRASVLSWLQADCDGMVLLTRDPVELRSILGEFEHGIQCESPRLTARLNRLVRQPVADAPRILSPPYIKGLNGSTQGRARTRARGDTQPIDIIRQDFDREAYSYTELREDTSDIPYINDIAILSQVRAHAGGDLQDIDIAERQETMAEPRPNGRDTSVGRGSNRRRAAMALWGPEADKKGD